MKRQKTSIIAVALIFALFAQLLLPTAVKADANRDSIIRQAVLSNKNNLRYDRIKSTSQANGASNVSNDEINNAIAYLTDSNGKTKISNQSFLMTMGMLSKRYDEMLWPATHNSFANDPDGSPNYLSIKDMDKLSKPLKLGRSASTENHTLSMREQLNRGVRCIDVDLGPKQTSDIIGAGAAEGAIKVVGSILNDLLNFKEPKVDLDDILGSIDEDFRYVYSYHRVAPLGNTSVSKITDAIKGFLAANPNDVVTLRISDIYQRFAYIKLDQNNNNAYKLLNLFLKKFDEAGLLDQTANYVGGNNVASDKYHEYLLNAGESVHGKSMNEWPKLRDMVLNNKRLIIITPTMYRIRSNSETVKNTETVSFHSPSSGSDKPYKVSPSRLNLSDDKLNNLKEHPERLIKIDSFGDNDAPAGEKNASNQNNNGRRFYDLATEYNKRLADAGVDHVLNFFHVDYFLGNTKKGGNQSVDIVDGANRVNFEQLGYNWSDVRNVDSNLYWNYIGKSVDTGVNKYIESASTTIDGFQGSDFIDHNVWSGTESKNLKNKTVKVKFNRDIMLDKVFVNFYAFGNSVPVEVKIKQDGKWYNVGATYLKQDYVKDWYECNLNGSYKTNEVEIRFLNDDGIHFKEVAFGGYGVENGLTTQKLTPTDDAFVKWGSKTKYNYHKTQYDIENMQVYNGEQDKATFLEFDTSSLRDPEKQIKKAYLSFKVNDINSVLRLKLREDRDAFDWNESALTGHNAKYWDWGVYNKERRIGTNGYVKIEVTDQIKDYLNFADKDNRMTYRISTADDDWFIVRSSETNEPPQLEVIYKHVPLQYKEKTINADGTTFVKWGSKSKYNYNSSSQLEIYSSPSKSSNSKTSFMKFNLNSLKNKKIKSAYLKYKIHVGDHARINIYEDRDATNWNESQLNGNAAKYFDDNYEIAHHRWIDNTRVDSINITNLIKNFVTRGDADGMITFRFAGAKKGDPWCYIEDRTSSNPPQLVIEYAD